MTYETLDMEISDEDKLRLVHTLFEYDDDLLKDIQSRSADIDRIIVDLVLSVAVAQALKEAIARPRR